MRPRLIALAVAAVTMIAAMPSDAATKTLDGNKVKKITFKGTSGPQAEGDTEQVTEAPDPITDASFRYGCKPPRCVRTDFVFKPYKGKKGNILFKVSWTTPGTDVDLFLIDKKSNTGIESCGAGAGLSETFVIPSSRLKAGKTYTVIADWYHTAGDSLTGVIEFPTRAKTTEEVPAQAEVLYPINCGLQD